MSYVRVSILGASPSGEVWSINPVMDPTFEFPGDVNQAALDAATLAIANLNPGPQMKIGLSSSMSLTGARCEVRDDGNDSLIATSTVLRAAPLTDTTAPGRTAQDAIVFSLRTNTPGGSGRGRLYWPYAAGPIDAQMRIPAATCTTLIGEFATYMHAIESALATAFPTIGFDLAVRSRLTHTTPHVNRVQIGNVVDVQRRRRDAMIETYTSVAF